MRLANREFTPRRIPTLATIVLLPILISLGFWQLDRAEQKRDILRQYEQQQHKVALNLNADSIQNKYQSYQQVEVTGRFDTAQQFLLDNKVYQGRAGYQVITPLLLPNHREAILVNRGWIPQTESRLQLPTIPTPTENISITGMIKLDVANSFHLGESGIQSDTWPRIIQWIDTEQMVEKLGYKIHPFVILLDPGNEAGFVREWYIKKINPEKNTSYAVQWFALALALVIIFLVVNTHEVEEVGKKDGIE